MSTNVGVFREFRQGLELLGFEKWDVSKDYANIVFYEFKSPKKRAVFVSLFDEKAYKNRIGDVNIHVNPLSNLDNYKHSDAIFNAILWTNLRAAGIIPVIGSLRGASKGDISPRYRSTTQESLYPLMLDCDKRSIIQPRRVKQVKFLLEEIEHVKNMFLKIESIAESISPNLERMSMDYPGVVIPKQR